jgi:uncharacterized protein DUF935
MAKKPTLPRPKLEPRSQLVREIDRLWQITQIKRNLEQGQFRDAALFCDALLADDRIKAGVNTRVSGFLGAPRSFVPANTSPEAMRIAELAKMDWPKMAKNSRLKSLHRWGLLLGVGVAQLIWDTSGARNIPALRPHHGQHLAYDWIGRRYVLTLDGGERVNIPTSEDAPNGDGQWLVHEPWGPHAWLEGYVRSLGGLFIGRRWTFNDWLRFSERFSQPFVVGVIPQSSAGSDEPEEFFEDLKNLNAEGVIIIPQGVDEKWDVKLVEAQAQGGQQFNLLLASIEKGVSILLLGHDLTTEAGGGGSFGAAKVGNDVRLDLKREDAEALSDTLTEQLLWHWTLQNFGTPELTPRVIWEVEPPAAAMADAQSLATLATACKTMRETPGVGDRIDFEALLTRYGVPLLARQ